MPEDAMKTSLLFAVLACGGAAAQTANPMASGPLPRVVPDASGGPAAAEAFRRLPPCTLAPDGQHLAVEPCRPAAARSFAQRRSVPQTISSMRPAPQAITPVRPSSQPPGYTAVPVPPAPSANASSLQPLNNCNAGGCRDASGTFLQGTGNTLLTPSGRPCRRDGNWVQCN
jgi:hypothetical protein